MFRSLHDSNVVAFFDENYLSIGDNIPKVLTGALKKSIRVIALMTEHYFASAWTEYELNYNFLSSHIGDAGGFNHIIPLWFSGEERPPEIAQLKHLDFRNGMRKKNVQELVAAIQSIEEIEPPEFIMQKRRDASALEKSIRRAVQFYFHWPGKRLREISGVLNELINNAFDHSGVKNGKVKARFTISSERLKVSVLDPGPGFDLPGTLKELKRANVESPNRERGRGLILAKSCCDILENSAFRGEHAITATFSRKPLLSSLPRRAPSPKKKSAKATKETDPRVAKYLPKDLQTESEYAYTFNSEIGFLYLNVVGLNRITLEDTREFRFIGKDLIQNYSPKSTLVDLTQVDYADSSAISALAFLKSLMDKSTGKLAIIAGEPIFKIFKLNALDSMMPIFSTIEEALEEIIPAE